MSVHAVIEIEGHRPYCNRSQRMSALLQPKLKDISSTTTKVEGRWPLLQPKLKDVDALFI